MKFVVIGGDAAGMSAASRAKRNKPEMEVTVLEKTTDVSYSACGMPYNIADSARAIDDLVVRSAEVFRKKQDINLLTGHNAESIDAEGRTVSGKDENGGKFEFSYDKLLIATGGFPIVQDLPGFDLPGVMVLKNLGDGRRIKEYIKGTNINKIVIIGMGYIALEMAEAFRALDLEVDMVKPRSRFLPWMNAELSQAVKEELERNNVGLYPGLKVERIEEKGGRLSLICNETTMECDMVLVAVGIKPSSQIAANAGLGLSVGDSIEVDRHLKTTDANIYAAGDCADAYHVVTGDKTWIPLALRANRAGWAVADNVCGIRKEVSGVAGTAVFKVFSFEVARTGLTTEEALRAGFDPVDVTIQSRSRAHAHPGSATIWIQMTGDRKSGLLLGVQMVGKDGVAHRINAPAVALHARMTVEMYSQTDLGYAPPFGPVWDPTLTVANQLLKKM